MEDGGGGVAGVLSPEKLPAARVVSLAVFFSRISYPSARHLRLHESVFPARRVRWPILSFPSVAELAINLRATHL